MNIGTMINEYASEQSPYTKTGLVNHLPMGQLALYQMSKKLEKVEEFSKEYIERAENPIRRGDYPIVDSIEECLGKRELYVPCLDLVEKKLKKENKDEFIRYVLNTYPMGMSSGLFHVLIRLGYAVEGSNFEDTLLEELTRAIAYYITAYREAKLFTRQLSKDGFKREILELEEDQYIINILRENETLGKRLKGLYEDDYYLQKGIIINGNEEEKIRSLLELLVPAFDNSGNIVVLHCITGIHALIMLKEYFADFNRAIDILTSTIITHLLALNELDIEDKIDELSQLSWRCIQSKACESEDIHAIKLTYSCYTLDNIYKFPKLKESALKRIRNN